MSSSTRIESLARQEVVREDDYTLIAEILVERLSIRELLALRQLLRYDVGESLYYQLIDAMQSKGILLR